MEVSKEFCQHFYEFWKERGILAAILEEEVEKK